MKERFRHTILVLVTVALTLASCHKIIHKDTVVSGTVYDVAAGTPIPDITVVVEEYKSGLLSVEYLGAIAATTTDSDGSYELNFDAREGGGFYRKMIVLEGNGGGDQAPFNSQFNNEEIQINKVNSNLDFRIGLIGRLNLTLTRELAEGERVEFNLTNDYEQNYHHFVNWLDERITAYNTGSQLACDWTLEYRYRPNSTSDWLWTKSTNLTIYPDSTTTLELQID